MGSLRVVVAGPPHSGKSTFSAALIDAIRDRKRGQSFNISFDYVSLDLEDNSLNAILNDGPEKLEGEWTEENVNERRDSFRSKPYQLVLADSPGKITPELKTLIQPADMMILLINDEKKNEISDWKRVANDVGLEVVFRLVTLAPEADGDLGWEGGDMSNGEGVICSISRDDVEKEALTPYDPTSQRMIRQIANHLLREAAD